MRIHKVLTKIGRLSLPAAALGLCLNFNAWAAPSFTATVDRTEIGLDESVSLKMSIILEGNQQPQEPQFRAPDFEVINEYNSTFIKSYYDNGHFGMQNERQITKVLKPLKTGTLRIQSISVQVGRDVLKAPDLAVVVNQAGAGSPAPPGYNSGGAGLRNSSARNLGKNVFLRAEVNKQKVFKGEQLIVSYYLYHRLRVFNIAADTLPQLNSFLKEELEMPVAGQTLPTESIVIGGAPYERNLLARYAAYPLQDGSLKIDPMSLKYNFIGGSPNRDDDPFSQLFQQMTPQSGESTSEPLTVEVKPLPDPKPDSFSGGVGDFNIISAIDKTEVHANEAVTLTVKVEGRGNVAAIGEPKAKWPDGVELYDSKGSAKVGKAGVGEKDFEFLLIPRASGKITLPALELSYFDPTQSKYVTRTTQPIDVTVLPALPGSQAYTPPSKISNGVIPQSSSAPAPAKVEEMRPLKPFASSAENGFHFQGQPAWRWLYWLCIGSFLIFVTFVGWDRWRLWRAETAEAAGQRAKLELKSFQRLRLRARAAVQGAPWNEVVETYELLSGAVLDQIDAQYHVGARSHSRSQLREMLVVERDLSEDIWRNISRLLEYAEMVRFALSAGAVTESAARLELGNWVDEGEKIARNLSKVEK